MTRVDVRLIVVAATRARCFAASPIRRTAAWLAAALLAPVSALTAPVWALAQGPAGPAPAVSAAPVVPSVARATGAEEGTPSIDRPALKLNTLRLAQPPAAVLLGSASMTVQRPSTPQALGLDLVEAAGQRGAVPSGVAFETSPYWILPHRPTISTSEYEATTLRNAWRRLSVSIAGLRGDSVPGAPAPSASVAIGARTNLIDQLHLSAASAAEVAATNRKVLAIARRIADARFDSSQIDDPAVTPGATAGRKRLADVDRWAAAAVQWYVVSAPASQGAQRRALQDSLKVRDSLAALYAGQDARLAANDARRKEVGARLAKALADSSAARASVDSVYAALLTDEAQVGFRLEAAVGWRARFPTGQWQGARWDGVGVWLTPTYRDARLPLQLTAIGRYLSNVRDYAGWTVVDGGGRLDYGVSRLSIGAELVGRALARRTAAAPGDATPGVKHASRWTADVEYKLGESTLLVGSVGSDFQRGGQPERPLVSTLGLTFGFGTISLRRPDGGTGGA